MLLLKNKEKSDLNALRCFSLDIHTPPSSHPHGSPGGTGEGMGLGLAAELTMGGETLSEVSTQGTTEGTDPAQRHWSRGGNVTSECCVHGVYYETKQTVRLFRLNFIYQNLGNSMSLRHKRNYTFTQIRERTRILISCKNFFPALDLIKWLKLKHKEEEYRNPKFRIVSLWLFVYVYGGVLCNYGFIILVGDYHT